MTDLPKPPVAATRPHSFERHGVTIDDPWNWLRDPGYPNVTSEEVLGYLKEENAYYEAVMKPLKPLADTLFAEMRGRIKEDDATVPQKDGDWLYWTDFEQGGEYRRWWRKPVAGGEDSLILDEPALAKGKEYFRLGGFSVSNNGRWLAYAYDDNGSERFLVRVKNLETGAHLPDEIPGMLSDIVWTADDAGFLYGLANDQWRTDNARYHRLGSDPAEDVELYHEEDEGYRVGVGETQSRQWIVISTGDHVTSEVRLLPADNPFAEPILVAPRKEGREYDVEEHDGTLFIHTNDTHTKFPAVHRQHRCAGRVGRADRALAAFLHDRGHHLRRFLHRRGARGRSRSDRAAPLCGGAGQAHRVPRGELCRLARRQSRICDGRAAHRL